MQRENSFRRMSECGRCAALFPWGYGGAPDTKDHSPHEDVLSGKRMLARKRVCFPGKSIIPKNHEMWGCTLSKPRNAGYAAWETPTSLPRLGMTGP